MRSLARGLEVLDFVARRNGVSFTDVTTATGLSKAVAHRVLAELVRSGFTWRGQHDRLYYAAPFIDTTPGGSYATLIRAAAAEPMEALIQEISWPSDLFMREGTHMVMIDSNRASSPFRLPWSRIGRRSPMLLSSVGRAVLAALPETERLEIYAELRRAGEWKSQVTWMKRPLDEVIRDAQKRGYAERETAFAGQMLERQGLMSIAAPIEARGMVLGSINIWWPISADTAGDFQKRYARPLLRCAESISRNLHDNKDAEAVLVAVHPDEEKARATPAADKPRAAGASEARGSRGRSGSRAGR